jgi:hypothetical protein
MRPPTGLFVRRQRGREGCNFAGVDRALAAGSARGPADGDKFRPEQQNSRELR